MIELSSISVEIFISSMIGLIFVSLVGQMLKGKLHEYLVITISLAVIFIIDKGSAIVLLIFAHIAYFVIHYFHHRKYIHITAWGGIAALMGYKAIQVILGHDNTSFFVLIGVSYYTFRIASVLFDIGRGRLEKPNYRKYMLYCLFFPIFAGGPVQRYHLFLRNKLSYDKNIIYGLYLISRAFFKKIFIADIILLFFIAWLESQLTGSTSFAPTGGGDPDELVWKVTSHDFPLQVGVLLYGFLNILRAYFDLSAFTDLALGLSRLFGYKISDNFNRPFLARNIIDFWRRWHLTIAGWAKDYIFSPLMLSTRNLAVAVFLTMIAMGLWHELSASWLFWGVCHGLGLILCGWWQRTKISSGLIKLEQGCVKAISTVINGWGVYISRPVSSGLAKLLSGMVTMCFFVPAWVINFGYMSLVFVAVSRPDLESALDFYRLLAGDVT